MLELLAAVGVVVKQSTATTATQDPRAPPATAGGSATPATASIPEAVGRSRGQLCATPLLTLSSSGNTRGQETQSSWAQNKRNSETIQRREPKPGLVNIHLIPPSRKSRESGAPESWWFHNETELKRLVNIHLIPPSRKSRESGAPALLTSRVLLRGNSAQSGSISAPNCGMSLHRKGRTQFLFSEFSEGLRATS